MQHSCCKTIEHLHKLLHRLASAVLPAEPGWCHTHTVSVTALTIVNRCFDWDRAILRHPEAEVT